jgi:hypothetical protein
MAGQKELWAFRQYADLEATAAHIVGIQGKIERLEQVKRDAWSQLLAGVMRAYAAGLDEEDLVQLIADMKASFGTGFGLFWNAHMPASLSYQKVRNAAKYKDYWRAQYAHNAPNGPTDGTWVGTFPIGDDQPMPMLGEAVVYVLFDLYNDPCYVGSTDGFGSRLRTHERERLGLARWMAYRCADREDAYRLEDRLLKEHMPHMNKKRGR